MVWVTWRQYRLQLLLGSAVLAVLLAFLLPSGYGIWSTFRSTGLSQCLASAGRDCGAANAAFSSRYTGYAFTAPLFLLLPALIGVFWGAPLVAREVEHGTHRLAWTQSVTRSRWAWNRIVVLSMATLAGSVIMSWVLSWWSRPFVAASGDRFDPGIFDLRGIAPVAYALFALALGIAAGTVIRRVVAAMGATLGGYAAVRVPVELWLRPHYLPPKTTSFPFFGRDPVAGLGNWVTSTRTVDAAGRFLAQGRQLNSAVLSRFCPSLAHIARGAPLPMPGPGAALPKSLGGTDPLAACAQRIGLRVSLTYQPAARYWTFQGIESALFVVVAAALLMLTVWFVRRRIA